jgi:hypothetical protein
VGQHLVVGDGAHEADDAHHDRPDGDQVEHEQRAEAGPAQDGQAREDADQAPASCQPQERWLAAAPMALKTSTTPLSKANRPTYGPTYFKYVTCTEPP